MKRLVNAVSDFFEARAELLREEAASLHLGIYAKGYKEGQEDIKETYGFEVAFIGSDDDDGEEE